MRMTNSFFLGGGFQILFSFITILALAVILGGLIKGIGQWNRNNHSPRLTAAAEVVSKRVNISHHNQPVAGDATGAHGFHTTTTTNYYVTFQVESGERMEFFVSGSEYGMLAEGDKGKLSFQGTRYLDFTRQ